jgi:hypothetical protein
LAQKTFICCKNSKLGKVMPRLDFDWQFLPNHQKFYKQNSELRTYIRDHSFKTSANFHDFWPLPPYHRHSSKKMLIKGIFDPYVTFWPSVPYHKILLFKKVTEIQNDQSTEWQEQFRKMTIRQIFHALFWKILWLIKPLLNHA